MSQNSRTQAIPMRTCGYPAEREARSKQPTAEHYDWLHYNDKRRWGSYWYQIREVLQLRPRTCLVVGKADGTVSDTLARCGVQVVTSDIDDSLRPVVVAGVQTMPFATASFDVVLCAQVLEHLPFDAFPSCLSELRRVMRGRCIISIPHYGRRWELAFWLSPLPRLHLGGKLPARSDSSFDPQHCWELGSQRFPRSLVEEQIRSAFCIERKYQIPDNAYHQFYILRAQ